MHLYLTYWERLASSLRTHLWFYMIPDSKNFHIVTGVQENILCFIKVYQLIIEHMFQVQLPNTVLKVSITNHALHEYL